MEKQTKKTALIIFTRVPISGQTKTRLFSKFSPEQAKELHELFLKKAIEAAIQTTEEVDCDVFFFYTPAQGLEILQSIVNETYSELQTQSNQEFQEENSEKVFDISDLADNAKEAARSTKEKKSSFGRYLLQEGEDLWEKMERAFAWCFRKRYEQVILFGTDIPEISGGDIIHALYQLHYVDVVIAPTFDKGYYLIGMRRPIPQVFSNLDKNNPDVCHASVKAIEDIASYAIVGKHHDVDTPEDLQNLIERLKRGGEECKKNLDDILSIIKKN